MIRKEMEFVGVINKYEDAIFEAVDGSAECNGQRTAEVYEHEWVDMKHSIAYVVTGLLNNENTVSAEGLAYIVISKMQRIICFSKEYLNIDKLKDVCESMLKDFNNV